MTVAFNSSKTISGAIESVLHQSVAPYEYIIVDGLSKDSTVEVAKSYQADFERRGIQFQVISERDKGIYDAMNKGICMCSGDIVGMINSDDWYEPNAVARAAEHYEKEKFDLFYADLRVLKPGKDIIKRAKAGRILTTKNWNHPTTFIARKIYDTYQYRCQSLYDDWDLVIRLRKAGCKTVVCNEILANFQFGGISNEKSLKKMWRRVMIKYRIYRQNNCSPLYFFDCVLIESAKFLLG